MSQVTVAEAKTEKPAPDPGGTGSRRRLRFPRVQPGLLLSWLVLGIVALWTIAPGFFTEYSATSGTAREKLLPPSAEHLLGTDELGRDLFSRIVHGSINSVSGALVAVGVGLIVGTLLGLLAGSIGGITDAVVMRVVDVLLSIPGLLLSLSIIIILGFGTVNAAIAVGIGSVASFARLSRSEVIKVRRSDFVEAAFGSGGTFRPSFAGTSCPTPPGPSWPWSPCSSVPRSWQSPPLASWATAPRLPPRNGAC